jgi:hypothetical protein
MNEGMFTTGDGCALHYRWDGPDESPVLVLSNSLEPQIVRQFDHIAPEPVQAIAAGRHMDRPRRPNTVINSSQGSSVLAW